MSEAILHQGQSIATAGKPLAEAEGAMILIHGRGASAANIMDLAQYLPHPKLAYLAPQATGNTWYPYSFLAPIEQNEPYLSSALQVVGDLVAQIEAAGIPTERIILAGFSQGACLASEFVVRNPRRYGGLIAFSGGIIGPPGTQRTAEGNLQGMPAFIGCSDTDFHIPLDRVQETTQLLSAMGAQVAERIYPNMGHTINDDEIAHAGDIIESLFEA